MRIKQRIDDFRVRELLADDYLLERGEYRVYRVTKRKLTSLEASRELAHAAGVPVSEVALAGLKDRQGVTTQYMSIRRGRDVNLRALDLTVESVGFARDGLESRHSLGNAFEVTLRGLMQEDLDVLRDNVPALRECGVINYFDEQRFGNLRHNQGWIAQQLMRGEHEAALKRLLASLSDHDDGASSSFKNALLSAWGDWSACRDIAGRFGQHHSVFEYLKKNDGDFAGAFYHVSSRLRLIHLYAFQSHIWNRAVTDCVASLVPRDERVVLEGVEGPLVYPSRPLALPQGATFRLPGPGLEDVRDPKQRGWLEDALSRERMVAADFQITGVSGFQLKGEERELFVQPRHLRVRPPERDNLNFGSFAVKVRFELQRGAYATLVVRRLLSTPLQAAGRERGADRGEHDPRFRHAKGEQREFGERDERSHGARDSRGNEGPGRGEFRPREQSNARSPGREAPPQHRESGESLAPPRRESYGQGNQGNRWQARSGQGERGAFQRGNDTRGNFQARNDSRGQFQPRNDSRGSFQPGNNAPERRPYQDRPYDRERGGGFENRGAGFDNRGRGFDNGGRGFDNRGAGFDNRGRAPDNRGGSAQRPDQGNRGDFGGNRRGPRRDDR